jgi:hypothetical protein
MFFFNLIFVSFTLENVDDSMAGKYRCIGKNRLGLIQSEFQLLIRGMSKSKFLFIFVMFTLIFLMKKKGLFIGEIFRKVKQLKSMIVSL